MTEKSKKFLSFFNSEKILIEALNKKQARLYNSLRQLVVSCDFNFGLAVTYLIKKERITKNLPTDLIEVVNIFKSIHSVEDKHPITLLSTLNQVDSKFITDTCQFFSDKKSRKSIKLQLIPKLPLLNYYNDTVESDTVTVDSDTITTEIQEDSNKITTKIQLGLNDQYNQKVTEPLDIDIVKDKDKDIVKDIKEKNIKKEKPKREPKKFIQPTIEEIQQYCIERKNKIDPCYFYDYYQSNGWMVGKNKMKDWKACVRTWEKRDTKVATPNWFDKNIKEQTTTKEEQEELEKLLKNYK